MNWQMVLGLNLFLFALSQALIKLSVSKLPRAKALFSQFVLCALFIIFYALLTSQLVFNKTAYAVVPTGFLVAFGAYFQWRAIEKSMSRTSLMFPMGDAITVFLAGIFLKEIRQWNLFWGIGIILCFSAAFLFRLKSSENKELDVKKWVFFAGGMVLIFGTAGFLMKFFSNEVPGTEFLVYWYIGAALGALPIMLLDKKKPQKPVRKSHLFLVPLLSISILGHIATQYWALELAHASQVVPVRTVGTTLLPILIGSFVFSENKGILKKDILAFAIGMTGALLIIFS